MLNTVEFVALVAVDLQIKLTALSIYHCTLLYFNSRCTISHNNAAVFFKFIAAVIVNNICLGIFPILGINTCQSSSKFCFGLIYIGNSSTLTSLVIKVNICCF